MVLEASSVPVSGLIFAVIGGGALTAIGAGLYKLGNTIGSLTRALEGFDERLQLLESKIVGTPPPKVKTPTRP